MKNIIALTCLLFLFAACSKDEIEELKVQPVKKELKNSDGAMVLLHQAELKFVYNSTPGYKAVGYIKVKNVAYDKIVKIRYTSDSWKSFKEVKASFYRTLDNEYEIWKFETLPVSYYQYNLPVVELAVSLEVNNQTYWDNNNGNNFSLNGCIGSQFCPDFILGNGTMVFGKVNLSHYKGRYSVNFRAYLRNTSYEKQVQLVYTLDNWKTILVLPGKYLAINPGQNKVEIWSGEKLLSGFSYDKDKIQAAIVYRENGNEHWDNNFGENYYPAY